MYSFIQLFLGDVSLNAGSKLQGLEMTLAKATEGKIFMRDYVPAETAERVI